MLDLNRISAYEPFEVGELRIFRFDGNDYVWEMARDELSEHCKGFKIALNNSSVSIDHSTVHKGDLNLVAISSNLVPDSPGVFLEKTRYWRYVTPLCYLKLVRYSSKVESPESKKHWLHFVMTTKPEAFPFKCIQYV